MKKIQIIFAAAAVLFAVAGVYASTFNTFKYYRHTTNVVSCATLITNVPACVSPTGVACSDTEIVGGIPTIFFYSRQEFDNAGVVIPGTCLLMKKPS